MQNLFIAGLLAFSLVLGAACEGFDMGDRSQASQAELAQQAKISADQARATAVAAVPGTFLAERLERRDGNVVYEVTVQPQPGGSPVDVQVDGTNGNVLRTEPANAREEDDD